MRFIITVDGVRREVEIEAGDTAAAALLAAAASAAASPTPPTPSTSDRSEAQGGRAGSATPAAPDLNENPDIDIRGGVPDAGVAPAPAAAEPADGIVRAGLAGRVIAVKVANGDTVRPGDPLLVIESLIQAPTAGTVRNLTAIIGTPVVVGTALLRIA